MHQIEPGIYFVKSSKQGYEKSPPPSVTPLSFNILLGTETTKDIEMFTSSVTNGGWIRLAPYRIGPSVLSWNGN